VLNVSRLIASHLRRRTSDGRYRPEVDGLRFIAIAVVIVGHLMERSLRSYAGGQPAAMRSLLAFLAKPAPGVYLFFAISGFIIASQFLKRPSNPLRPEWLKAYFKRRVLRIEPPYIILLTFSFLVVQFLNVRIADSARFNAEPRSLVVSFVASTLYSHGWLFGNMPRLFPPGWSLEVEVQFYILAPLIFASFFSVQRRSARLLIGLASLALAIYMACFIPWSRSAPFVQYTLCLFLPYFWLGVLLADWQADLRAALTDRPFVATAMGWLGLGAFLLATLLVHAREPISGLILMTGLTAGIFSMFCSVIAPVSSFRNFCALPAVSMIGGQCYSIYLTHLQVLQITAPALTRLMKLSAFPALLVAAILLQVLLVLLTGVIFYVCIERPFMADNWPHSLLASLRRVGSRGKAVFDPSPRAAD
jgi:peptidoglycan/LPS O-acetylase OafA/YrhL